MVVGSVLLVGVVTAVSLRGIRFDVDQASLVVPLLFHLEIKQLSAAIEPEGATLVLRHVSVTGSQVVPKIHSAVTFTLASC